MPSYVLLHRHDPLECPVVFAAWKGFDSPLRRRPVASSCGSGDHRLWWTVEALDPAAALGHLPPYVAARTEATEVREVIVP